MIISRDGECVTYINKARFVVTRGLGEALAMEGVAGKEMSDRIKYAKEVLSQMVLRGREGKKAVV